jgi:hypothetical protein
MLAYVAFYPVNFIFVSLRFQPNNDKGEKGRAVKRRFKARE